MTVIAAVAVVQWADARVAATLIDDRPWLAHLIERLRRASCVSRVVVVCHPGCAALITPLVPPDVIDGSAAKSQPCFDWPRPATRGHLVADARSGRRGPAK